MYLRLFLGPKYKTDFYLYSGSVEGISSLEQLRKNFDPMKNLGREMLFFYFQYVSVNVLAKPFLLVPFYHCKRTFLSDQSFNMLMIFFFDADSGLIAVGSVR